MVWYLPKIILIILVYFITCCCGSFCDDKGNPKSKEMGAFCSFLWKIQVILHVLVMWYFHGGRALLELYSIWNAKIIGDIIWSCQISTSTLLSANSFQRDTQQSWFSDTVDLSCFLDIRMDRNWGIKLN